MMCNMHHINAVRLDSGQVHLSTINGGDVSPFGPFLERDVMTCSDLAGPTSPCTWTKALDGTALGLNGYGIDALSSPS